MTNQKRFFFGLFFLGFILRILLLFYDFSFDVNNHITWAKDLWQRGFGDFYNIPSSEAFASKFPNYPPLSLFMFYIIYPLQSIIYNLTWWLNITFPIFPSKIVLFIESRMFLAGLMKLPAIFADLGLAAMSYKIAQKMNPTDKKPPLIIAALILFNPAFFYNSALWGQIDVIPLLFIVFSFYFLFFSKRHLLSNVIFTLAILIKPTVLVFLPFYILFFIKKNNVKNIIYAFIIANIIFWISFLPFIKLHDIFTPYSIFIDKILTKQSLPFVTNGAFNFWILITYFEGIKDIAPFVFGISYRIWGYILVAVFWLLVTGYLLKNKKITPENIFLALALFGLGAFLFLTKMHDRYLMLPLPFLLLASVKYRKLLPWFLYLSLISFLNMYHSWPVPRIEPLFQVINHPFSVKIISMGNLFVAFYLLYRIKSTFAPRMTVENSL